MIERLTQRLGSSYRLRLTIGYVAVIAVLGAAWLGSLFGPLTSAVTAQQQAHLDRVARADALALESSGAAPQELAGRLGGSGLRVTIVAADGRVLADSENDPTTMENHSDRPEIVSALAGRSGSDVRKSRTEGIDQMYVAEPATYRGQHVAMRVSESLASVGALAAQARNTGLILLVFAMAVSAFVTVRLSSSAAAPVKRLAEAAHAIAQGDSVSVPREPGELGVVSDALSDLGEQVRHRMAEAEAEQANLRTVLDGLDDGVLLLDGETVRLANGAMSQLFRMPFGGWRDHALDDSGLPPSLLRAVREARGSGRRFVQDVGPDPTGRTLRVTVVPVGIVAGEQRTLVAVADVSERARLDAMRRDFVANASHELKTPASAIQLLAESAATAASDGDTEQALAFAQQMRSEADRLRKLVLDLLDLSRFENVGSAEALTDVRDAVDLAITAHRATAEAKHLVLAADLSAVAGEDVFLAVEPTDAAIALDNLLSNAIAYTDSGGVGVRVEVRDGRVAIEVRDTGIGIPAEALPRVFERFFRVDKGRSRESGGTGLGLSLVKHVVERNGGDVTIASQAGAGTTVTLLLPRAV